MNQKIKKDIIGYLTILGNLWITLMLIDWDRLFKYQETGNYDEYLISRVMKLGLAFLIFFFVIALRKARITSRDHFKLSITFGLFAAAEIAFFKDAPMIGIGLFGAAQIALIIRNLADIKEYLYKRRKKYDLFKLLIAAILIIIIDYFIIKILFSSFRSNPLYIYIVAYSGLLCLSVSAGISTTITGYFSRNNATLIVIGVILLYMGDITVGMNILFHETNQHIVYIISSSLTWFFYLPSILFLALSGISWNDGT